MVGLGVFIAAGVMASVSAYFLFQLSQRKDSSGLTHDSLQIVFLFMVVASLLLLGKAGYDGRLDCEQLLSNSTVNGSTTSYEYTYACEDPGSKGYLWLYKLPLWLAELSGLYLIIYYFNVIKQFIKNKQRGRE